MLLLMIVCLCAEFATQQQTAFVACARLPVYFEFQPSSRYTFHHHRRRVVCIAELVSVVFEACGKHLLLRRSSFYPPFRNSTCRLLQAARHHSTSFHLSTRLCPTATATIPTTQPCHPHRKFCAQSWFSCWGLPPGVPL
jgi:hypothetical protein